MPDNLSPALSLLCILNPSERKFSFETVCTRIDKIFTYTYHGRVSKEKSLFPRSSHIELKLIAWMEVFYPSYFRRGFFPTIEEVNLLARATFAHSQVILIVINWSLGRKRFRQGTQLNFKVFQHSSSSVWATSTNKSGLEMLMSHPFTFYDLPSFFFSPIRDNLIHTSHYPRLRQCCMKTTCAYLLCGWATSVFIGS